MEAMATGIAGRFNQHRGIPEMIMIIRQVFWCNREDAAALAGAIEKGVTQDRR